MNHLIKKRFQSMDGPEFQEIWQIYLESFPFYERRTASAQKPLMKEEQYFCTALYEEKKLIGILFYFESESIRYVEHLAIHPLLRGKNYGSKIMADLCNTEKMVLLEIDPPIDEISKKRQYFYENLGFHLNPYLFIHPSYSTEKHPHELKIMTYPRVFQEKEYQNFLNYLQEKPLSYIE